jgi:hypothetical protein
MTYEYKLQIVFSLLHEHITITYSSVVHSIFVINVHALHKFTSPFSGYRHFRFKLITTK